MEKPIDNLEEKDCLFLFTEPLPSGKNCLKEHHLAKPCKACKMWLNGTSKCAWMPKLRKNHLSDFERLRVNQIRLSVVSTNFFVHNLCQWLHFVVHLFLTCTFPFVHKSPSMALPFPSFGTLHCFHRWNFRACHIAIKWVTKWCHDEHRKTCSWFQSLVSVDSMKMLIFGSNCVEESIIQWDAKGTFRWLQIMHHWVATVQLPHFASGQMQNWFDHCAETENWTLWNFGGPCVNCQFVNQCEVFWLPLLFQHKRKTLHERFPPTRQTGCKCMAVSRNWRQIANCVCPSSVQAQTRQTVPRPVVPRQTRSHVGSRSIRKHVHYDSLLPRGNTVPYFVQTTETTCFLIKSIRMSKVNHLFSSWHYYSQYIINDNYHDIHWFLH